LIEELNILRRYWMFGCMVWDVEGNQIWPIFEVNIKPKKLPAICDSDGGERAEHE